jgi:hypothetical protein
MPRAWSRTLLYCQCSCKADFGSSYCGCCASYTVSIILELGVVLTIVHNDVISKKLSKYTAVYPLHNLISVAYVTLGGVGTSALILFRDMGRHV